MSSVMVRGGRGAECSIGQSLPIQKDDNIHLRKWVHSCLYESPKYCIMPTD